MILVKNYWDWKIGRHYIVYFNPNIAG